MVLYYTQRQEARKYIIPKCNRWSLGLSNFCQLVCPTWADEVTTKDRKFYHRGKDKKSSALKLV